jgi:putative CocE/NonD family hydrolase
MLRSVWLLCLCLVASPVAAQSFSLPAEAFQDEAALAKSMPDLAKAVIGAYHDDDQARYLDTLFRLQIVAGQYAQASDSLTKLRALRANDPSPGVAAKDIQYAIFLRAKALAASQPISADRAFPTAFREVMEPLDDRTSALVVRALVPYSTGISLHSPIEETLRAALRTRKGKTDLPLADAISLLRAYQVAETYRAMAPLTAGLIAEDDQRRYLIDSIPVAMGDGASVCALIVRPRAADKPLPTLLEFTIYADPQVNLSEARRAASNGYVGVEGTSRGKLCSPGPIVPNEQDGADAAALIDWIARQPWSDGRVGMYGGSYDGFTQWAAAKHRPAALKAMMPAVTEAPGIDSPTEGGIIQSFNYYWPFYVTDNNTLDDAPFNDRERFNRLYRQWYKTGVSYRSMDKLDGPPNPIWDRWLDHPSYDAYWQAMIPFGDEFAHIHIPVLTTTGYYDGGQIGALYYLTEHYKHDPKAEHYLVVGPYDHHGGNRGTVDVLGDQSDVVFGYKMDPAAQIDLGELRFQWFDYVFKAGPKPAILRDKINYEVMGANTWRHAPSIATMADRRLKLHLSDARTGPFFTLAQKPRAGGSVTLTENLADRSDIDRVSPASGDIEDPVLDTDGAVTFESAPFDHAVQLNGLFSGHLAFTTNKKDFDFQVSLYELTPQGKYFQLSYYLARASSVPDHTTRHLLKPGMRQHLDFTAGRATSRQFQPGSRLVVMISTVKQPGVQINYGTGKDVSDETIEDAGPPLTITWSGDSFIEAPLTR